jgi:Phage integrase family
MVNPAGIGTSRFLRLAAVGGSHWNTSTWLSVSPVPDTISARTGRYVTALIQNTVVAGAGRTGVSLISACRSPVPCRLPQIRMKTLIEMLTQRLSQNKTSPVFPTSTGTLRDPINTQKQFKHAFAPAGFEGITSHVLRKTAATEMLHAGLPALASADQLAHAQLSMSQDVYAGRGVVDSGADRLLETPGFQPASPQVLHWRVPVR